MTVAIQDEKKNQHQAPARIPLGGVLGRDPLGRFFRGEFYGSWTARGKFNLNSASPDALLIAETNTHFNMHFGHLNERNIVQARLVQFPVLKDTTDQAVLVSYGESNPKYPRKVKVHLAHFHGKLLELQKAGFDGIIVAHVPDMKGTLYAIKVWFRRGKGCVIHSSQIGSGAVTDKRERGSFLFAPDC